MAAELSRENWVPNSQTSTSQAIPADSSRRISDTTWQIIKSIYQENREPCVKFLQNNGVSLMNADDAAQEAAFRLGAFVENGNHIDQGIGPDSERRRRNFFIRAMLTAEWDRIRRAKRGEKYGPQMSLDALYYVSTDYNMEEEIAERECLEAQFAAILPSFNALNPQMQQVILFKAFSSLSNDEIANRVGTTSRNVRVLFNRARHKLKGDPSDFQKTKQRREQESHLHKE